MWLGWRVTTVGDVNGDGFSDVMVSGKFYDELFHDHGEVWLFYGSAAGLSATPDWIATAGVDEAFGCALGAAGDVNAELNDHAQSMRMRFSGCTPMRRAFPSAERGAGAHGSSPPP